MQKNMVHRWAIYGNECWEITKFAEHIAGNDSKQWATQDGKWEKTMERVRVIYITSSQKLLFTGEKKMWKN